MTTQAGVIQGRIGDRPVAQLFQSLHEDGTTAVAHFRTALGSATVWFHEGEIIDADMGRFHMEAAVLRLLKIQDGEFEVTIGPVDRRRVVRSGTAQLLAEGRKRAPRQGSPSGQHRQASPSGQYNQASPSGQYSQVGTGRRDDSRPRRKRPTREGVEASGRASDTDAHTAVRRQPKVPSAADTDAHTAVGARSPVVDDAIASGRARRRGAVASWQPTAGGRGEESRPIQVAPVPPSPEPPPPAEPEPEEPLVDDAGNPTRGRTKFMFGIAGPTPAPKPRPRRKRVASSAGTPVPAPQPATPVAATPAPAIDDEDYDSLDKTLMRVDPAKKAPRAAPQPASPPVSARHGSGSIPVTVPGAVVGAPVEAEDDISHPITVPTMGLRLGPGGTMMLGPGAGSSSREVHDGKPLPPDPGAEATVVIDSRKFGASSPASSSGIAPGKPGGTAHVGRYEVLLRLARGAMGTLYLCRVSGEGGFRKLFALKVIRDHLNSNQAYVDLLLEEVRIAAQLSHPNIVDIVDIDTFAGQHYIVLDYVEGCSFSELLGAHPRLRPPELVVPILVDALTGLHAAHTAMPPVVHCDFSPHNMLVGVNGICRTTEFGVAKADHALPAGSGRSTPGYLSPERIRGLPLDPRSDIFSAGVVLWNALTGEQLFSGDNPEHVMHQVVSAVIPKPSTVGLRPPACFDAICMRALERDPQRRYQTAEQMLTDLRKVAIAHDLMAPSSEVGRWVQESFGAQIDMRRQAAGLPPGTGVGVSSGAVPISGHSSGRVDVQAPRAAAGVPGASASQTMMLQGDPEVPADDEEGMGARARVVVLLAALAFGVAAVLTLFIRPDLLQQGGGIIGPDGKYVPLEDLADPPTELPMDTTGDAVAVPATTTGPAADGSDTTGGDTETAEGGSDDTTGEPEPEPEPEPKGTSKKDKGKKDDAKKDDAKKGDAKKGDAKKGDAKGNKSKGDGGDEPPPDLDELFKPPGA